jgi:hypothetical protein
MFGRWMPTFHFSDYPIAFVFRVDKLPDCKFEKDPLLVIVCFRFDEAEMCRKENEAAETKSGLERRQEHLRARLDDLEEQALTEKTWQLKGEVSACARPQNSLLEEVLEFDLTTRPGENVARFSLTMIPSMNVARFWLTTKQKRMRCSLI